MNCSFPWQGDEEWYSFSIIADKASSPTTETSLNRKQREEACCQPGREALLHDKVQNKNKEIK